MTGHRRLPASGWGAALRIARRELLRAKGRTLLVLLMVLLPLTAVVGLDTLLRTAQVDVVERLPRDLGGAEARVDPQYGPVQQDPSGGRVSSAGAERLVVLTPAQVQQVLDPQARLLAVREGRGDSPVRTADGRTARVQPLAVDLRDPALRGPFTLLRGRAPSGPGEVAVTPRLERFGFPAGTALRLPGGEERTVVGTVLYPLTYGAPLAVLGLPEAVGLQGAPASRFWVSGAEVTWDDVQQLNGLGASVLSRSVVLDPPPADQVPAFSDPGAAYTAAVIGLIAVIAVLEVVLLAGPAFAVGARRQRRALALLAAGGGEPKHVRRVVLAQGLLVGGTAAVLAIVLGVGGAALARRPLTAWFGASWGPFEVSARDVVLVCLLGAGTAVLAALVPAVLAGRQPVVAALQGRRTVAGRRWVPSAVGVVLLGLGVLSCYRALGRGFAEFWVAASAVPTVLGAAALAPAALALLGRAAGRLPLPLRFAVRDADRQRGRTAPAVAAVTAVVAGVVALATAAGSDGVERETANGTAALRGQAVVTVYGPGTDYPALASAARRALPGEAVTVVPGLPLVTGPDATRLALVCRPDDPPADACPGFDVGYGGILGTNVVVGTAALDALAPQLTPAALAAARTALASGRALVAGATSGDLAEVRLVDRVEGGTAPRALLVAEATVRAEPLVVRRGLPPVSAVLPDAAARTLGGAAPVSILVGDDVTPAQQARLQAAVERVDSGASAYVERPGVPDDTRLVVLLLGLGAGTLVLAGSLAATSLALTEARPDLVTLGQVGARPRTRRLVAASYAFVLAVVGAVLGCAAGLVPGVAGAVALNRGSYVSASPDGSVLLTGQASLDVVDVPWLLLLGLVVVLPLLTAAVAGLSVRSRLPGLGRRVRA